MSRNTEIPETDADALLLAVRMIGQAMQRVKRATTREACRVAMQTCRRLAASSANEGTPDAPSDTAGALASQSQREPNA